MSTLADPIRLPLPPDRLAFFSFIYTAPTSHQKSQVLGSSPSALEMKGRPVTSALGYFGMLE